MGERWSWLVWSRSSRTPAHGTAGSVVVRGEPGVGKSALLAEVLSTAGDAAGAAHAGPRGRSRRWRSRRCTGCSDRSSVCASGFPEPQARALRVAFGEEDGPSVEPFLVGVATLSMLTDGGRGGAGGVRRRRRALARLRLRRRSAVLRPTARTPTGSRWCSRPATRRPDVRPRRGAGSSAGRAGRRIRSGSCSAENAPVRGRSRGHRPAAGRDRRQPAGPPRAPDRAQRRAARRVVPAARAAASHHPRRTRLPRPLPSADRGRCRR